MSNNVNLLEKAIKLKKENIEDIENSIIVLKGISLKTVYEKEINIDLDIIRKNKLNYLINLVNEKRKYITYEEFALLGNLIVEQYSKIYILNNNLYMNLVPIEVGYSGDIRKKLITNFTEYDDNLNDDEVIGDIDDYSSIYNGLKEVNGYLLGSYNEDFCNNNIKIEVVNIFDIPNTIDISSNSNESECFDIIDEADYIALIRKLFEDPSELTVRINNFEGDKNDLKYHLSLINNYFNDCTDILFAKFDQKSTEIKHDVEFKKILKKYWNYDNYKNDLMFYNQEALNDGRKEVVNISQEQIVSELVEQVENCMNGKDYSDIFVTAPTSSGKSVMFQVPAIYLAEKYDLLTIVISPLIGLMNDQVKNLENINYRYSKTINSDISPILKNEIIEKVSNGEIHILYISPETLLSRSDVEQLIGKRKIGMIVVDEAHIVTTWGKQFRPDYWYLGDHISKLRKKQQQDSEKNMPFVVSTFTATAIYGGIEDMYQETVNSLHLLNPIVHLGCVKRNDDIKINITKKEVKKNDRTEYELDKLKDIEDLVDRSKLTNKKTLIYFPTVSLIDRCWEYLCSQNKTSNVSLYYGPLDKDKKTESLNQYKNGEKMVMLATKAFGMGIDISDIEIVAHFAPTGNVCDYVQEIGRGARQKGLVADACYKYVKKDFKFINRLHGLSAVQPYHLVKVLQKIYEIYQNNLKSGRSKDYTRRRNAMLIDAENFSYIFNSFGNEDDDNINKVKTALLLIQKDFENTLGFSPINVKPIPLFAMGFFKVDEQNRKKLLKRYKDCLEIINENLDICRIRLDSIWDNDYRQYSFPNFKFLVYSNDSELDFNFKYQIEPYLCVDITLENNYKAKFDNIFGTIKKFINSSIISQKYIKQDDISKYLSKELDISIYKAASITEVLISSINIYMRNYNKGTSKLMMEKATNSGDLSFRFFQAMKLYFDWIEYGLNNIVKNMYDGTLYLSNRNSSESTKQTNAILGVLETLNILTFKMVGGNNSQIYIYINQIQKIQNIIRAPYHYKNRLLEVISKRHKMSVIMLTYLYENEFSSDERWEIIEDYFLGVIPKEVKEEFELACN